VSDLNPSAAPSGEPQTQDVQQLIALLGNLMPLLLRFQSQVQETPFQGGFGNIAAPNPALDQQAAVNLIGDITAASLRNLSAYLETNAGQHASLLGCVPIVTQAAHQFGARDYTQAFNLIWHAYRVITSMRAADPRIPPLQVGGLIPSEQTHEQTQSVH
jgi:hypothetical protein